MEAATALKASSTVSMEPLVTTTSDQNSDQRISKGSISNFKSMDVESSS
jgi:hypothetical protein